MSSKIVITSARREDIPEVQRIAREIWHAHYPGIIPAEQIEYMLDRGYATGALEEFLDEPDAGIELALDDDECVGFAAWYATGTGEVKLDKLYVLQSHQRRGVGGKLIARVASAAKLAGAAALILNVNKRNMQAIRAYERHGFAIRSAVEIDIGHGFVMDDFVMAKPLKAA